MSLVASDKPLVSIIITSFNYAQYLRQTIQSVLDQTYDHWELIIIDDASTDNSLEIINSFSDPRITVIISKVNQGAVAAYTQAYPLCRGKYFSGLDSDDWIAPDKLEKQVRYLEEHSEVDILGTFVTEVAANGQMTHDVHKHEIWFNSQSDLNQPSSWLWQNHLCHSSVLMRKSTHDQIGDLNPDLVYTPDYEFWLRCLIGGAVFHMLKEKLTYYRAHGENVTYKNPDRTFLEYVYIFCEYTKPYLLELEKYELINERLIEIFDYDEPYRNADDNFRTNVIENLLSIKNETRDFTTFLDDLQTAASPKWQITRGVIDVLISKSQRQQAEIAQLYQGKAWLEQEWQNWQRIAAEQQAITQQQHVTIQQQQATIQQQQATIQQQQATIQQQQATIQQQQTTIQQLDGYLTSLRLKPLIRLAQRVGLLRQNIR